MAVIQGSKLRLMVVDDESDNLDLLYRTFRREFEVFRADSGIKALQILEQEGEMGIIISDQRMPRMNGTEFLSRTVQLYPDTIRILLTGYTDVEDLVGAINQGKVFKYITKPWNPQELETIVRQAAETYQVVKQRTSELHRILRRESIFNAVTTAIRRSLDYHSMLKTVVNTIGHTFKADACVLYPLEATAKIELPLKPYIYTATPASDCPILFPINFDSSHSRSHSPSEKVGVATDMAEDHSLSKQIHLDQLFDDRQIQWLEPDVHYPYRRLVLPLIYQQENLAVLVLYQREQAQVWSDDEVYLIQQVTEQAALAVSQAKLYQRTQQQTEQMRAELAVARQIQMNLLRQCWSTSSTVRIQAQCQPAREVGGDFFEVYVHPQGDVWIAVGDVSGKGVPAALFMASAISLLRRELAQEHPPDPHLILQNMNTSLSEDLVGSNCFITIVLARYSPNRRELVYANAGHIYPLVWSRKLLSGLRTTNIEQVTSDYLDSTHLEPHYLKVRGVPLGILPVWQAASGHLTLAPGEILLMTSDGITEATIINSTSGSHNFMLQQTGLWNLLSQQQGELNLGELLAQIQAHTPYQEDDQTILSLEVL
ncbi:SpoIIE family protein phosphatase [Thermocoleostomius sinensis]|uniref:SpoIIE family protein phosphatase n=1 Tax=Thermocoleostomius sinensis A174 TaxID=2016057 RepID=A0A9E9CBE2_9CYAN|nr:SpoIIE family protein phosphatase [Thermocoleostomius sinensis]WAL60395.1 SpoIIE family protein phosphatase [Thermocoleostomius sinensis A174]